MADFKTYTLDDASGSRKDVLETVKNAYGFVPNLMATMVESPELAKAYLDIGNTFGETSLSKTEQQVVLLAVSRFNECEYCVSAHTTIAKMEDVDDDIVAAIRDDESIDDEKLEALRRFTTKVVGRRGWLDDDDVEAFLDAGYGRQQVLEVVLGVAMKTLSNYTNHIAGTKIDDAFADSRWKAPEGKAA